MWIWSAKSAPETDLKPEAEQVADTFASEHMIKQSEMDNFILGKAYVFQS